MNARAFPGLWLAAVFAAALLPSAPVRAQSPDVAENRECATCHIMWLNDFKRSDVTPLIPYDPRPRTATGRQDVSSTERMCFSCHDGFMLDSRVVWRNPEHAHPVGMKPSNQVRIPTSRGKVVFPLNDDGKMYCGTCHSAHGVDWKQDESPVFMRAKNVDSSLCFACHLDRSTGPEEGNHPVFEKIEKISAELRARGAQFGRGGMVICQSCHNTHSASQKKMLVMSKENSELCGTCHADKVDIRQTKHDMAAMAPAAKNNRNQSVEESGPCGVCHLPHKANGPGLWARELHPGVDGMSARCLSCHNPQGLAKKKTVGEHSHPVNVPVSEAGITATPKGWTSRFPLPDTLAALTPLPLYDDKGLHTHTGGKVGCGSCHDPHRWAPDGKHGEKPKTDLTKVEGDGRNSFLRLPLDATAKLCANCHVDKAAVLLSKHNATLMPEEKARTKKNPDAAEKDVCATCHTPHNAKSSKLWSRERGPDKGETVALCTSCHRDNGVAGKKLTGKHSHPFNQPLARGMQTQLPLFGGSKEKGANVECATCHDPHQWDPANPKSRDGATTTAEGDANTSFLRRTAGGRSELCVDCHRDQRLVRGTDHDLAVTAAKAVNAKGQTTAQSGVCGQCHAVHNAESNLRLWARAAGAGQDAGEKLCRSCHAANQPAAAKQLAEKQGRHPPTATAWSPLVRARFNAKAAGGIQVYGTDGKPAATGAITCNSCHNPHQWSASKAEEGPGKNTEGDVRTSFLRVTNTESFLCADCHGRDALFRYKYFHGQSAHRDYPLFR